MSRQMIKVDQFKIDQPTYPNITAHKPNAARVYKTDGDLDARIEIAKRFIVSSGRAPMIELFYAVGVEGHLPFYVYSHFSDYMSSDTRLSINGSDYLHAIKLYNESELLNVV